MKKISLLFALLLMCMTVHTAAATSSLTVNAVNYDGVIVKGESFTVSTSITASSVESPITVTVTLIDNGGGVGIVNAVKQVQFNSDSTMNVEWSLTGDVPGTYDSPFTITATASDSGAATPKSSTTSLVIKDRPVIDVSVVKNATSVSAGDAVRLDYTVTNLGEVSAADATDVVATLTLPSGWSLETGESPSSLGTIVSGGGSKSGYWIVTADSPAASNTLTVDVASSIPGNVVPKAVSVNGPSSGSTSGSGGSGGSSGGGGGGGAGGSGESYDNIAVKNVAKVYLNANTEAIYAFNDAGNPIDAVSFNPVINAGSISTVVEVLNDVSEQVDTHPPGVVYKNMNIWVGKGGWASEHTISDPKISFSVEKSWIAENDIDPSAIRLLRYTTKWTELTTTKTNEDADRIYYTAETPGFSPFAIVAMSEEVAETEVESPGQAEVEDTTKDIEHTPESKDEESPSTPGFESLLATGLVAAAYIVHRRRE